MSLCIARFALPIAFLCGALVALAALFATSAHAAEVSISGGTLRYLGGPERNRVAVSLTASSTRFMVADANTGVTPGPGCSRAGERRVTCPAAGVAAVDVDLLGGDDRVSVAPSITIAAAIQGGDGADFLVGGSGADSLAGGADADDLDGRAGNDVENGGDGADTFVQGPVANGGDSLSGGAGVDRANYGPRTTGLRITLDDAADDGDTGATESDNVRPDVERVTGGRGPDSLVGSPVGERLDGGAGNDFLDGREGADAINAGAGADSIGSRDLSDDAVDCGADADTVRGDSRDRFAGNCEATRVSAPIQIRRFSSRLGAAGTVRVRVRCEVTAFGRCTGRVVVRTARRVATRQGRRRVRVGSTTFDLNPGTSEQVRVPARPGARRLIRRHRRLVRASVRGGDSAGPARGARTVFMLRR